MTTATISPDGGITIPESIRKQLNLKAGMQLGMDVEGEALVLKRVVEDLGDWRTMRGMAAGGESLTKALMEERAADKADDERKVKGS